MLLILIFISQTVLAQTPVMPVTKFNDRSLSQNNDDLNIKAACSVAYMDPEKAKKCVKQYEEEKVHFRPENVRFCGGGAYFVEGSSRARCIDVVKNKHFNISNLKNCMDKEKAKLGHDIAEVGPYIKCLNDRNNFASGSSSFESGNVRSESAGK